VKSAIASRTLTDVVPIKPLPEISIVIPGAALDGVKLAIVGSTLKLPGLVATPDEVVTVIAPFFALLGTKAVIEVKESAVKFASRPANRTAVTPQHTWQHPYFWAPFILVGDGK
jgi:CHAT domain-containing protein